MRIKIFFGALLLLVLNSSALFAQIGMACDYTDPDAPCGPIDSWVIVLAFAAVGFAAMHLLKKRKPGQYTA